MARESSPFSAFSAGYALCDVMGASGSLRLSEHVGPADYAAALTMIRPQAPVALEIHVPQITPRNSLPIAWSDTDDETVIEQGDFIFAVSQELMMAGTICPARPCTTHVRFAGPGSSDLTIADVSHLLNVIEESFGLTDKADIHFDLDARRVSFGSIHALSALGLTSATVFVGDFDPDVQKSMGRIQPVSLIRGVIEALRHAGVFDVALELAVGLDHQDPSCIHKSIASAVSLAPEAISIVSLRPGLRDHACQSVYQLAAAGYAQVRKGLFRHDAGDNNLGGRWGRLPDLRLGFGPEAYSQVKTLLVQNLKTFQHYAASIEKGHFATYAGLRL